MQFSKKSSKNGFLPSFHFLWAIFLLTIRVQASSHDNSVALGELGSQADETRGRRESGDFSKSRKNSPALNHFLEDVLKAQDELKWIDRAVHNSGISENSENLYSKKRSHQATKSRWEDSKKVENRNSEDGKTKRDLESSNSDPSLAALKRTIFELSESLRPGANLRQYSNIDGKRKLLSSQSVRSGMDVAIQYYDYEEEQDPVVRFNNPRERQVKSAQLPMTTSQAPPPAGNLIKIDQNAEEEKKQEEQLQKMKDSKPKEEFLGEGQMPVLSEKSTNPPSSAYNILKRISGAQDVDSSDYNGFSDGEFSRDSKNLEESKNLNDILENEQNLMDENPERAFIVISSSKKTRKRSVGFERDQRKEKNFSIADKSARNFEALKITDDMFKGGFEQSNPLNEDNPLLLGFPAISSSNASVTPVLFRTRSTTEWKIINVNGEKNQMPKFGRHLTQINQSELENISSISAPKIEILNASDSTPRDRNSSQKMPASKKIEPKNIENTTMSTKFNVSDHEGRIFMENVRIRNNTRLRRHARPYVPKNLPKHRNRRFHRHNRNYRFRKYVPGRKRESENPEGNHKKLSTLFAADNIEDESQIEQAAHGELAGKIVERIFQEVQRNEGLKVALGPGLYRKHKPEESMALDKMYQQGLDKKKVKETEALMKRVMELLGRLVVDEVRRKTCAPLSPEMRDFLQWTLGLEDFVGTFTDQAPPLGTVPGSTENETTTKSSTPEDKFLFPNATDTRTNELRELDRKIKILKGLIKEYNALSEREKTQVQTVHDYLVRQLGLLIRYIESKEAAEKAKTAGAFSPQQILQYQAAMPSVNATRRNSSSIGGKGLNNREGVYSIFGQKPFDLPEFQNSRVSEKRSSWAEPKYQKRSHNVEKNEEDENESIEYRKLLRQIANLRRRKRADPFGYEEPKIYLVSSENSSTFPDNGSSIFSSSQNLKFTNHSIPIRGNNRLEDEVLLLNKREAWKKENQLLLEEVAFGKDTRNDFIHFPYSSNNENSRQRRENRKHKYSPTKPDPADSSKIEHLDDGKNPRNLKVNQRDSKAIQNGSMHEQSKFPSHRLARSIESMINVFPVEVTNASTSIY